MKIDVTLIEETLKKLKKKNPVLFKALQKKIVQISKLEADEIQHFKNLRHGLKEYKRVHVGKSFVLMFKVEGDTVIFGKFEHHDNAY
jgi:YafQ family addiction module toxin component